MVANKIVALTGASSGIGAAAALHLAERGARLVLGARSANKLDALVDRIKAAGGQAVSVPTDVSQRADLERLVALGCERFGRLDVLVSNAGVMPIGPLADLAVADWDQMIDVNIKGVLYGIAAALPVFRAQGAGHFIQTASTAARKTVPNQAVYAGTKAAVLAISDGLRQELAGRIRVTVVSPGFTATNVAQHVRNPEVRAQIETSRDRFAMPPEAVARAIAYAIDQPDDVNIGEIVVRSTAQA